MPYRPRHQLPLPRVMRGLADLIEPAGTPGYRARHRLTITEDKREGS